MTTIDPIDAIYIRAMHPQTEARLAELEADTLHIRHLDGRGAKAHLDAISKAMDCGPYTDSEARALADIQAVLTEMDVEKAALRMGLFVRYLGN